jgi:hypothetical protein
LLVSLVGGQRPPPPLLIFGGLQLPPLLVPLLPFKPLLLSPFLGVVELPCSPAFAAI